MKLKLKKTSNNKNNNHNISLPKLFLKYGFLTFIISTITSSGYIVYKYYDEYFTLKDLKKQNMEYKTKVKMLNKTLKSSNSTNFINKKTIIQNLLEEEIGKDFIESTIVKYQIKNSRDKTLINDIIIKYNKNIINDKKKLIIFLAALYNIKGVEKIVDITNNIIELVYKVPQDISMRNVTELRKQNRLKKESEVQNND